MDILTLIAVILTGILGGYFINYLSDILPLTVEEKDVKLFSRPVCPKCNHYSYWKPFLLFKKCYECGENAPLRHKIVVTLSPLVAAASYFYMPKGLSWWMVAILLVYLAVVAIIDLRQRIILGSLSFFGLAYSFFMGYNMHGLPLTLLGGASGLAVMLILYWAGMAFTRYMEKKKGEPVEDALGFGDVYISTIAGCLVAFPDVFSTILLAIIFGGVTSLSFMGIMLVRKQYKPLTAIPYAPFIILATVFLLFRPG